jgi:hypothetical protein
MRFFKKETKEEDKCFKCKYFNHTIFWMRCSHPFNIKNKSHENGVEIFFDKTPWDRNKNNLCMDFCKGKYKRGNK